MSTNRGVLGRDGLRETKVPEVTALFWTLKILSTAFGEVFSDYLFDRFDKMICFIACFLLLAVTLFVTVRRRRFSPRLYWFCIAIISVFGTMAADGLHFGLGVSLPVSCAVFAGFQIVVFALWQRREQTLDMKDIDTVPREIYYWATVMGTFALGTGAGDLTAFFFKFGFFASIFIFLIPFVIAVTLYSTRSSHRILTFWIAYTLTRPLGASVSDWFAAPGVIGGLDWGTGPVSLLLGGLCLATFIKLCALTSLKAS